MNSMALAFGQAVTQAAQPMHAAASMARSALTLGTGVALPSGAHPVGALMKPPAETIRSKLFEPYFSTKNKGTGLGLAIVRRIAQDHGGESFCEPLEPGSCFGLEIPLRGQTA